MANTPSAQNAPPMPGMMGAPGMQPSANTPQVTNTPPPGTPKGMPAPLKPEQVGYSKEMEAIIKALKANDYELDVSGLKTVKDKDFMNKAMKEKYEIYYLPRSPLSYMPNGPKISSYGVILDSKTGKFWVQKIASLLAPVYYGPGVLDKAGKVIKK